MAIGRKISVLVIRAGDKTEPQLCRRRSGRRKRRRPSGRAHRIAREKAVPIRPLGFETGDIEMDRIGEGLFGGRGSATHDFGHAGIGRDLITQRHVGAAHAARRFRIARQRLRREPRPQHKAVGPRRAGSNAEAERIAGPPALRGGNADQAWGGNWRRDGRDSGARGPDKAMPAKKARKSAFCPSRPLRLSNIFAGFYDMLTPEHEPQPSQQNPWITRKSIAPKSTRENKPRKR